MTAYSVGKEVLSYCNKCKLTLAHLIASMKSEAEIDKVVCKTCKSTHAFKDPSVKKPKASVAKIVKTQGRSGSKKASEPVSVLWEKALTAAKVQPQEYSIKVLFKSGDVINHPTFGQGVVERSIDNNKIEVLFKEDYKVLLHNKK